jgi:hypothetical protein
MATPAERAKAKQHHRHGRRHHEDPARVAEQHRRDVLRAGGWRGPLSAYGSTTTNTGATAPGDIQTGHLNPGQFVGYPGGFSTDAGNYTGVQAIEGAAGNGGAGGTGDSGASGGTT